MRSQKTAGKIITSSSPIFDVSEIDLTKSSQPEETDTVEVASIRAVVDILISFCNPAMVSAAQIT
jgi:hypothetical protein